MLRSITSTSKRQDQIESHILPSLTRVCWPPSDQVSKLTISSAIGESTWMIRYWMMRWDSRSAAIISAFQRHPDSRFKTTLTRYIEDGIWTILSLLWPQTFDHCIYRKMLLSFRMGLCRFRNDNLDMVLAWRAGLPIIEPPVLLPWDGEVVLVAAWKSWWPLKNNQKRRVWQCDSVDSCKLGRFDDGCRWRAWFDVDQI